MIGDMKRKRGTQHTGFQQQLKVSSSICSDTHKDTHSQAALHHKCGFMTQVSSVGEHDVVRRTCVEREIEGGICTETAAVKHAESR